MNTIFNNRTLAFSQIFFERLLFAYPSAHREEYGADMAQLFRDQSRDAWQKSRYFGLLKLWLRVLPDLVKTSVLEQLSNFNPAKFMSNKINNLFSSPSAVFFKVFTLIFLLVVVATVAITYILPEYYTSTARIKVEQDANNIPGMATPTSGTIDYDPYFIQTTFEIIQSEVVLDDVINKLNLNILWGKKYFNGQVLKNTGTMNILKKQMVLARIRGTKLIAITVYSDDPDEAARIANAVAESYRNYRIKIRAQLMAGGLETLQEQYQIEEKQIEEVQDTLGSLRQQFKITDDASAKQLPEDKPYWDEKIRLKQILESQQLFAAKIEAEKMDAQLTKAPAVEIIDYAQPGHFPVKPNKPVNITIGIFAGGFLGLVIGGASALMASMIGNRRRKNLTTI